MAAEERPPGPAIPLLERSLEARLLVWVAGVLLVFAFVAGLLTYRLSFSAELQRAEELIAQLVAVVREQAEVALFADNLDIADGVIDGLKASELVAAARMVSASGSIYGDGAEGSAADAQPLRFELYSPVDGRERVGQLLILPDARAVEWRAGQVAMNQVVLLVMQTLIAALVLLALMRVLIILPIRRVSVQLRRIEPGSEGRVAEDHQHRHNELGQLQSNINQLLSAAQQALAEIRRQANELEQLATRDHLTGLPSRRLMEDRLETACRRAEREQGRLALMLIDLDGFKDINDRLGHEAGDQVLKAVAGRLLDNLRASDTASRWGGDEFFVILPAVASIENAEAIAAKLLDAIGQDIDVDGEACRVSASIGISVFPDHSRNIPGLQRLADEAMYAVKRAGKSGIRSASGGSIDR